MLVWDVVCQSCGSTEPDQLFDAWESPVPACTCGGSRIKLITSRYKRSSAVHSSERIVVYQHPQSGDVKYPGRNDIPMPSRYRSQGYERVELGTLADATRFERTQGVACEALHYDRNGTAFREDAAPAPPKVTYSDLTQ